jgi:hypothetical protein
VISVLLNSQRWFSTMVLVDGVRESIYACFIPNRGLESEMGRPHLGLLTLGVLLIILAAWSAAWILEFISRQDLLPGILLSVGIWMIALAGLKAFRSSVSDSNAFSTFSWGMLILVIGGSWWFSNSGMPIEMTLVFVLLLLGLLAIVTALRSTLSQKE